MKILLLGDRSLCSQNLKFLHIYIYKDMLFSCMHFYEVSFLVAHFRHVFFVLGINLYICLFDCSSVHLFVSFNGIFEETKLLSFILRAINIRSMGQVAVVRGRMPTIYDHFQSQI
jgi:hypothetical protein